MSTPTDVRFMMLWTAPPPARECHEGGCCLRAHDSEEPIMQAAVRTIGFDIAKSVFQVHGVDAELDLNAILGEQSWSTDQWRFGR